MNSCRCSTNFVSTLPPFSCLSACDAYEGQRQEEDDGFWVFAMAEGERKVSEWRQSEGEGKKRLHVCAPHMVPVLNMRDCIKLKDGKAAEESDERRGGEREKRRRRRRFFGEKRGSNLISQAISSCASVVYPQFCP